MILISKNESSLNNFDQNNIPPEIPDFTSVTCTNLMIKLKIWSNKLKPGESIKFLTTREGDTNLKSAFNNKQFTYISKIIKPNVYLGQITKN